MPGDSISRPTCTSRFRAVASLISSTLRATTAPGVAGGTGAGGGGGTAATLAVRPEVGRGRGEAVAPLPVRPEVGGGGERAPAAPPARPDGGSGGEGAATALPVRPHVGGGSAMEDSGTLAPGGPESLAADAAALLGVVPTTVVFRMEIRREVGAVLAGVRAGWRRRERGASSSSEPPTRPNVQIGSSKSSSSSSATAPAAPAGPAGWGPGGTKDTRRGRLVDGVSGSTGRGDGAARSSRTCWFRFTSSSLSESTRSTTSSSSPSAESAGVPPPSLTVGIVAISSASMAPVMPPPVSKLWHCEPRPPLMYAASARAAAAAA